MSHHAWLLLPAPDCCSNAAAGREYPAELVYVEGDKRLCSEEYTADDAAGGEFEVEAIVDEVALVLPGKKKQKVQRWVLPKWKVSGCRAGCGAPPLVCAGNGLWGLLWNHHPSVERHARGVQVEVLFTPMYGELCGVCEAMAITAAVQAMKRLWLALLAPDSRS